MQQGLFFPNTLLENKELTWTEKVILVRIKAEIALKGECRLRNKDLSEVAGVMEQRIAQCLARLEKKGYLKREKKSITAGEKTKRKRYITLLEKSL